jgi:hypothetical protein
LCKTEEVAKRYGEETICKRNNRKCNKNQNETKKGSDEKI